MFFIEAGFGGNGGKVFDSFSSCSSFVKFIWQKRGEFTCIFLGGLGGAAASQLFVLDKLKNKSLGGNWSVDNEGGLNKGLRGLKDSKKF